MNGNGKVSSRVCDKYDDIIYSSADRFWSIKETFNEIEKTLQAEYKEELRYKNVDKNVITNKDMKFLRR